MAYPFTSLTLAGEHGTTATFRSQFLRYGLVPVDGEHECMICLDTTISPVILESCCDCRPPPYCRRCITDWFEAHDNECPICHTQLFDDDPDQDWYLEWARKRADLSDSESWAYWLMKAARMLEAWNTEFDRPSWYRGGLVVHGITVRLGDHE